MYSSGNPTNIANPIKDASVQVDIKTMIGKLTLYQTTLCKKLSWEDLPSEVNLDSNGGLDTYNKNDVQLICCQPDSSTLWLIPDPVQTRFIQALDQDSEMDITFTWALYRDRPKGKEVVTYPWIVPPSGLPKQADVQKVLNGSMTSFKIKNVYPRYFRVTGSGEIRPLELEVHDAFPDFLIQFLSLLSFDITIGASSKTPPYMITLQLFFSTSSSSISQLFKRFI